MNSPSILGAHRAHPFALFGALMLALLACGNESINVLAPRDASADTVTHDDALDVSIDVPLEVSMDVPSLDDGVTTDAPTEDVPVLDMSSVDGDGAVMDAPPPTDAPTIGCLGVGMQCSFAGACCSLTCPLPAPGAPRVCAADGICTAAGTICGNNGDCCGNRCYMGVCERATGSCQPAGELCASDGECCGGKCTSFVGGPTRCVRLGGACRVLGEVCVMATECCSGQCQADGSGTSFCAVAPPCNTGGIETRGCRGQAGDRSKMHADCCSGVCGAGAEGVQRCSTPPCGGLCALCAEDRDCCAGHCGWDDGGNYRRCD